MGLAKTLQETLSDVSIYNPGPECFHRRIVTWWRGGERVTLKLIWRDSAEVTDEDIVRAVLDNQHKAMTLTMRDRWINLSATVYLED